MIQGKRDGKPYTLHLDPDDNSTRRRIGLDGTSSLTVFDMGDKDSPVSVKGTPAFDAGFKPGDEIKALVQQGR